VCVSRGDSWLTPNASNIASWSAEHKGYALWKIGRAASHIVRVGLTPMEASLFQANERMLV
jgi:hypothetical protein